MHNIAPHSTTVPTSANGVSDAQMRDSMLGSAWPTTVRDALPPPTYEYARDHPGGRPVTARTETASSALSTEPAGTPPVQPAVQVS